ncbi:MAG: hypothetical protein GC162_03580 [Planctomycetes bacterium]|nr:hypothetical protein [Planctomycetota bacterium]
MSLALAAAASAGGIRATVQSPSKINSIAAIQRQYTDEGVFGKSFPGRVDGDQIIIDNLPDGATYDLHIETEQGTIEGWDAQVPRSDYEQEQPLSIEGKHAIFDKLAAYFEKHYPDDVVVLDIQGNIQNAALLVAQLRRRDSVGGGFKPGEWAWRVDRFQYENPQEHNWAPYQERPFYALERRRLFEKDYAALRITFDRRLGGIRLDADHAKRDLGIIQLPVVEAGVHAVNAEGSPTKPIIVKPRPERWPQE